MHVDLLRDAAKTFPKIDNRSEILTIRIWHCKYKTLQILSEFKNLNELVIASFPDESLECLAQLPKLRYLSILHMPKVSNLEPLSQLKNIESLSLSTAPSWDSSGKRTVVESINPITGISNLKHLELFGVGPENKSLSSLEGCKDLQTARFSQCPEKEIVRFYRATGVLNHIIPNLRFKFKRLSNSISTATTT